MNDLKSLKLDCNEPNTKLKEIEIRLKEIEEEKQQLLHRQELLNDLQTT